jgi:transaldolase
MPEATMAASEDHGSLARSIDVGVDDPAAVMDGLTELGVDMDDVGHALEQRGVASFHDSFTHLLAALETKTRQLTRG